MKATLQIEIDFESWFDDDREPKTKEEWKWFFDRYLVTGDTVIGKDHNGIQDLVRINSIGIECLEVEKGSNIHE